MLGQDQHPGADPRRRERQPDISGAPTIRTAWIGQPGGSSGGAAAIIAAGGGAALDLGSDVGGKHSRARALYRHRRDQADQRAGCREPDTFPRATGHSTPSPQIGPMGPPSGGYRARARHRGGESTGRTPSVIPMPLGASVDIGALTPARGDLHRQRPGSAESGDCRGRSTTLPAPLRRVGSRSSTPLPEAIPDAIGLFPPDARGGRRRSGARRAQSGRHHAEEAPASPTRSTSLPPPPGNVLSDLMVELDQVRARMLGLHARLRCHRLPGLTLVCPRARIRTRGTPTPPWSHAMAYNATGWPGVTVRAGTRSRRTAHRRAGGRAALARGRRLRPRALHRVGPRRLPTSSRDGVAETENRDRDRDRDRDLQGSLIPSRCARARSAAFDPTTPSGPRATRSGRPGAPATSATTSSRPSTRSGEPPSFIFLATRRLFLNISGTRSGEKGDDFGRSARRRHDAPGS